MKSRRRIRRGLPASSDIERAKRVEIESRGHKSNRFGGAVGNLRFLVSSIGSVTNNASNLGQNVYNIFCVGLEAYAAIYQDGYSAQYIYRPPIYSGEMALNASAAFKMAFAARITNDEWIINLRSTLLT